ncbi:MAG: sensor histidine kinase [Bradymonadia bacterium]
MRLLIVDDREENLFSFQQILKDEPYALDLASSAQDALRFLLKHPYACILCDVQMPDIDGLELARIVRADPELRDTPIIFITAHSYHPAIIYEAFELGAFDFISKPIDPIILRGKLRIFAQLYKSRAQIAAQHAQMQTIVAHLEEGVALLDPNGQEIFVNRQLEQLLQRNAQSRPLLDQLRSLASFTLDESTPRPLPIPIDAAFNGIITIDQLTLVKIDGQELFWELTLSPLPNPGQQGHKVLVLIRDVTQRTRQTMQLQSKNRELEQFAYVASHDLKAPLRHISVFTTILSEELEACEYPAEVDEAMGIIHRSTTEMRDLIDGLLEFSRAGRGALNMIPCALDELLTDVWSVLQPEDAIDFSVDADLPIVFGDRDRLRQVFQNLLSNAIKFRAPARPLHIRVSVEPQPTRWRIKVIDNGIGIDPDHQERVFQIFSRLHTKDRYDGNGIGLSIVKKIVERHDGHILIESDGQSGTTFCVDLPRHESLSAETLHA